MRRPRGEPRGLAPRLPPRPRPTKKVVAAAELLEVRGAARRGDEDDNGVRSVVHDPVIGEDAVAPELALEALPKRSDDYLGDDRCGAQLGDVDCDVGGRAT